MQFQSVAELFASLSNTSKRLEKLLLLRDFFTKFPQETPLLADIIAGNYQRQIHKKEIGISSKTMFTVIAFVSQNKESEIEKQFNTIGDVGHLAIHFLKSNKQQSLASQPLTLQGITSTLEKIATTSGKKSNKTKQELLSKLFLQTGSKDEQMYLARILVDDLRIGVSEGLIREACVITYLPSVLGIHLVCDSCGYVNLSMEQCLKCGSPLSEKNQEEIASRYFTLEPFTLKGPDEVHEEHIKGREDLQRLLSYPKESMIVSESPRATYSTMLNLFEKKYNLLNSFRILLDELRKDPKTLLDTQIRFGRPIKSMLGTSTTTLQEATEITGLPALLDFKYDGLRLQVHNEKGKVRLFSRNLDEITPQFPELVRHISTNFSDTSFVMDCEGVGYDREKQQYLPFQVLSRRILTKNVDSVSHIKVVLKAFDLLSCDGETLTDLPFEKRREKLEELFIKRKLVM